MKKFSLILVLLLAGCGVLGTGTNSTDDTATKLVTALVNGCKFVPTPGTISGLVSSFNLQAGAAASAFEQVASAVCAEVTKTTHAGAEGWKVIGLDGKVVEVHGEFTK